MAILVARATPLHRGSVKPGGHVRLRLFATLTSPALSPVLLKLFTNASLVACAPLGDLNRIIRARDVGIGSIAAGSALTLAQVREIICTDVAAAAAGSEGVLLTQYVPRARLSGPHLRGMPINNNPALGTHETEGVGFTMSADASADASGRVILTFRASAVRSAIGTASNAAWASGCVGYVDLLFQHSLFRV